MKSFSQNPVDYKNRHRFSSKIIQIFVSKLFKNKIISTITLYLFSILRRR
jgi:hypothetical protein